MANEYVALPLTLTPDTPGPKISYILDRLVEHDGYWSDFQAGRREKAAGMLVDSRNIIHEIWRHEEVGGIQPVGLVIFTNIVPYTDCQFHPIFFDGKMSNFLGKRNILLSQMVWAFRELQVERISVEIPEFRGPLIQYARKKLGFRFEAEGRSITRWTRASRRRTERVTQVPDAAQAALGSRKHRIVRYHGGWYDMMLLSVTRDEFAAFLAGATAEESHDGTISTSRPTVGAGAAGDQLGGAAVREPYPSAGPAASSTPGPSGVPPEHDRPVA